jgi:hypothetical protein
MCEVVPSPLCAICRAAASNPNNLQRRDLTSLPSAPPPYHTQRQSVRAANPLDAHTHTKAGVIQSKAAEMGAGGGGGGWGRGEPNQCVTG